MRTTAACRAPDSTDACAIDKDAEDEFCALAATSTGLLSMRAGSFDPRHCELIKTNRRREDRATQECDPSARRSAIQQDRAATPLGLLFCRCVNCRSSLVPLRFYPCFSNSRKRKTGTQSL